MTKMYHTNVPRSFAAVRERYNTLDFPCRKIVCQGALPLWDPSHAHRSRRANVQTSRVVFAHFKGGSASSGHPAYFLRLYICKTHFASAIYSLENNNLLQLPSYLGMRITAGCYNADISLAIICNIFCKNFDSF